jgi:hypothetical protein
MDISEMVALLEGVARDQATPASARVRALEVLLRISKSHTPDDDEWTAIIAEFGAPDAQ